MNEKIWIFVVIGLGIILALMVYQMNQEKKFRQKIRDDMGHPDKDALLNSDVPSVRDGKTIQIPEENVTPFPTKDLSKIEPPIHTPKPHGLVINPQDQVLHDPKAKAEPIIVDPNDINHKLSPTAHSAPENWHEEINNIEANKLKVNLSFDEISKQKLSWFDPRFDYLAYVVLEEAQEFNILPRFSNIHRFQIAGCTLDNCWQLAEPIPNVYYQGFIIGLQAISRQGLASKEQIEAFGEQVHAFANKLNAQVQLTDVDAFLTVAQPLDAVCARVDQTIPFHLVSRTEIKGSDLRAAVEKAGFELGHDGAFHLLNEHGHPQFSIVALDNSAFTTNLLANQTYQGFTMLFDIPHTPAHRKAFDQFMHISITLSSDLSLDLVSDKLEVLSTEWLKNVQTYVSARHEEMEKVDIIPGSELSSRLFL